METFVGPVRLICLLCFAQQMLGYQQFRTYHTISDISDDAGDKSDKVIKREIKMSDNGLIYHDGPYLSHSKINSYVTPLPPVPSSEKPYTYAVTAISVTPAPYHEGPSSPTPYPIHHYIKEGPYDYHPYSHSDTALSLHQGSSVMAPKQSLSVSPYASYNQMRYHHQDDVLYEPPRIPDYRPPSSSSHHIPLSSLVSYGPSTPSSSFRAAKALPYHGSSTPSPYHGPSTPSPYHEPYRGPTVTPHPFHMSTTASPFHSSSISPYKKSTTYPYYDQSTPSTFYSTTLSPYHKSNAYLYLEQSTPSLFSSSTPLPANSTNLPYHSPAVSPYH